MSEYDDRPWQGTLLGVISVFHFLFISIGVFALLTLSQQASGNEGGFITPLMTMLSAILFILLIINLFKGAKWALLLYIAITTLILLNALTNLSSGGIIGLLVNGGILGLQIFCLKHPFYQKERL